MNAQTQSPTPNRRTEIPDSKKEMDFFNALRKVLEGKKIHKLEWKDKEYYGYLSNGILTLHKPDGKDHQWILGDGDMGGNDFVVI